MRSTGARLNRLAEISLLLLLAAGLTACGDDGESDMRPTRTPIVATETPQPAATITATRPREPSATRTQTRAATATPTFTGPSTPTGPPETPTPAPATQTAVPSPSATPTHSLSPSATQPPTIPATSPPATSPVPETPTATPTPSPPTISDPAFRFAKPRAGELVMAGAIAVELTLPADAMGDTLTVRLDGVAVPDFGVPGGTTAAVVALRGSCRVAKRCGALPMALSLSRSPRERAGSGTQSSAPDGWSRTSGELSLEDVGVPAGTVSGTVNVGPGEHVLEADVLVRRNAQLATARTQVSFEAAALDHAEECEVLNSAECLLPYPSSRFLEPADTPTGFYLKFPEVGMPLQNGRPVSPQPLEALDGFSPLVQVLMHFPGGVDPVRSNASRLLPETRTCGTRSLDADSPTVLLDADTGERILHFIEPDARAADPARRILFLRPGRSLTPGHRYIVAVRNLVHADGTPVQPEAPFAVLRDGRPTSIAAVEARRPQLEAIFAALAAADPPVPRDNLLLAFDFVVQSDEGLTSQMLSMRDQAFAFLANAAEEGTPTFAVDADGVEEHDCAAPGATVWRIVEGTYQVPLFLTSDPALDPPTPGMLNLDERGVPVQNGFTRPPFTIAIPCRVLMGDGPPAHPIVLGHGLFGSGRGLVRDVAALGLDYIGGATDWWDLSAPDLAGALESFIVRNVIFDLNNFGALPDRLRQGQLNTLVLARMMKSGMFNVHPAFQTPRGEGVFPAAPDNEQFYFGASLGGIMGLMFSALSPDVANVNVDVPAINFPFLLQRATPFIQYDILLRQTGVTDPMQTALGLSLVGELWVRGEPAGYATHITSNPLPGTNAKNILMTMAFLDQQVSNTGTEIAARTLGLPNLEGSLLTNLPEIPDVPGPLSSALVIYDTGSFDLRNPAHTPFIPPLANLPPTPNSCDPHGRRGYIPASIQQLLTFAQPGGQIVNFCNGLCDAAEPSELPYGAATPCDPLAPP